MTDYFKYVSLFYLIGCSLFFSIYEIYLISLYNNNIYIEENIAYNFICASCMINLLNTLSFMWLIFHEFIIYNYILLIILNISIGIMSISFYNSVYQYGRFNNIIDLEMIIFYVKLVIFGFYIVFGYYTKNNQQLEIDPMTYETLIKN